MTTAEELLKSLQSETKATVYASDPEILTIDSDSRTINVPESERLFGVKGDMNIERKYFRCPKIVGDNIDLSQHQIFIAYVYTETESGSIFPTVGVAPYHCEDVEVDGEDITFSWKLTGNVFKNPGFILFKMYAKRTETDPNTVFNTTPAIGTVLATIPDGTEEIIEEYPDVIAQIFDRLDALESGGGTGGTTNYENLTNQPQLNGVTLVGNKSLEDVGAQNKIIYDATKNGLSSKNSGLQNSQALQSLIDKISAAGGGSIYIPSGQYQFASNGSQTTGEHCIKLKSNVKIYGDGASTILLPTGNAANGLDMFYFNDYIDNSNPTYLENCIFRDFVIDGTNQSCTNYTSAGKGFMINLMKNCHWYNVTVKNMDATGFGVDCPINCSMEKCYAIGNGKAAEITDVGASGFGIGFGYSYDESMFITGCTAVGNKKFGIFFEHQRRFDAEKYTATGNKGFLVAGCTAEENYNNFGGIQAISALYRNCVSQSAIIHGYFFQNSEQCNVIGCYSNNDGDTSFVVLADNTDGGTQETKDVAFISCISKYPRYGAKLVNLGSTATMQRNIVKDCYFNSVQTNTILTSGTMQSMVLEDNVTNSAENSLGATVTDLLDRNNSWNSSGDYTLPIMSSAQLGGGKAVEKTTEDVPVAVDPSTGQLFVPTYPESTGGSADIPRQEMQNTDTTVTLEPNKLYVFPEMESLTITLGTPSDANVANEYHFFFTSGATTTTLTLNDVLSDAYSIEANMKYEVSILEGVAYIKGVAVSAA